MKRQIALHESYRDDEPSKAGSDRAFGCIVGTILIVLGSAKCFNEGGLPPIAFVLVIAGTVLLLVGLVAPSRLSLLNRLWLRLGAAIGKVVNPVILAILFFLVVSPMAIVMRLAGKRPLRLAPDRTALTYWRTRHPAEDDAASMRWQF